MRALWLAVFVLLPSASWAQARFVIPTSATIPSANQVRDLQFIIDNVSKPGLRVRVELKHGDISLSPAQLEAINAAVQQGFVRVTKDDENGVDCLSLVRANGKQLPREHCPKVFFDGEWVIAVRAAYTEPPPPRRPPKHLVRPQAHPRAG